MRGRIAFNEDLGKEFGKPDLERLGIFAEMPYMNGRGYVSLFPKPARHKGASFLSVGKKIKDATQSGYFEETFKRIYEGEGITWRKKKIHTKPLVPFILGHRGKKLVTPGDYYGTFSGKIEAFSNIRAKPTYKPEKPNCITNNPRKGGPGYANICLNRYPEHTPDPYKPKDKKKQVIPKSMGGPMVTAHYPEPYFDKNPFPDPEKMAEKPLYLDKSKAPVPKNLFGIFMPTGPGKWQGGTHDGCFDKFPEFKKCKYVTAFEANKPTIGAKGPVFNPPPIAMKTMFTTSVVHHNTDLRVNNLNYKKYQPNYDKYLLD